MVTSSLIVLCKPYYCMQEYDLGGTLPSLHSNMFHLVMAAVITATTGTQNKFTRTTKGHVGMGVAPEAASWDSRSRGSEEGSILSLLL